MSNNIDSGFKFMLPVMNKRPPAVRETLVEGFGIKNRVAGSFDISQTSKGSHQEEPRLILVIVLGSCCGR